MRTGANGGPLLPSHLEVRQDFDDDEPRILDVDLAARLGYARPEKIRDLIRRMHRQKRLPSAIFTTAGKKAGDDPRGRIATECWLDERSALKVIAKSETDVADAAIDEVIDIFVRVRRGEAVARTALHLLLSEDPCDWDRMWEVELRELACCIYRKPSNDNGSWVGGFYSRIYEHVLGREPYRVLRERNRGPRHRRNHHQFLVPPARERFRQELRNVITFLRASLATPNPKWTFWDLMRTTYSADKSVQLSMRDLEPERHRERRRG